MKSNNLKFKIFNFKKQNVKLFVVFFVAAFLFLMLTKFSQNYTQSVQLNVKLNNLEDEVILLNDSSNIARVTINAKGFSLLRYLFNDTKSIQIDAKTDVYKTKDALFWDVGNNKFKLVKTFGNSVEILGVKPDTLKFKYDVLASKKVPIKFNNKIEYASGFNVIDKLKLSQDSVKIVGSKRIIDSITFVQAKSIELLDVKTDILKDIEFKSTALNIEIIPNKVTIKGTVKRFTEGKINLPVRLKNIPSGKTVDIFPKQVDLIYYVDIENFKNVNPNDFQVICDFNKFRNQSLSSLDLEIAKTSLVVKNSRLVQNSVQFIISD